MAEIRIARNAGFCFGVRRATGLLEDALEKAKATGETVYTLGHIIHNHVYLEDVTKRGAVCISHGELCELEKRVRSGERAVLIIRAHGEKKETVERLRALEAECENFSLLDGTCPYVEKVRRIACENSGEGKAFILIGAAEHPEVEGIMSCTRGDGYVFRDENELSDFLIREKDAKLAGLSVSMAAQTTQKLSVWKKCLENLKKVYTNGLIFDTICSVTEKRQTEAAALAAKSDITVVIGSEESSNSRKLFEVTGELCPRVYFVGDAKDAENIEIPENSIISITAGASTPDSVIQEVYEKMKEQMTENFAEMLETSMKTLNTGDVVEGIVTSVSAGEIHVDLGSKTTGVIAYVQNNWISVMTVSDLGNALSGTEAGGLQVMLEHVDIGKGLIQVIVEAAEGLSKIIRSSGMQIYILLAALQEIPPSIYEAAKVEGCSAWECFWKITIPSVVPQIIICGVYTLISVFTATDTEIYNYIVTQEFVNNQLSFAAAMNVLYLLAVGLCILIGAGVIKIAQSKD